MKMWYGHAVENVYGHVDRHVYVDPVVLYRHAYRPVYRYRHAVGQV